MNNQAVLSQTELKDSKLFYNILIRPSETLKFILNNNLNKYTIVLLVLGGIVKSFDRAIENNSGDETSLLGILGINLILGALLGWIGFYIYAAILSFTGEWLGGKAGGDKFRTVIAWALVPAIISLVLLLLALPVLGNDLFSSTLSNDALFYKIFYYTFLAINFVLHIWSLLIFIKGVKIIQKFGTMKAIANALFPAIALTLLILFIFGLVKLAGNV